MNLAHSFGSTLTTQQPQRIGPYEIREVIGRGGMAAVYKAYQPSLDRVVAIKVISAHLASDPEFMERFRQEALAIAKLSHPNIMVVYDFGEDIGSAYMVMEYVEGTNLADMIDAGVQNNMADHIISQVAAGLDYAHSRSIVHRDIKPQNVLVTPEGRAVLADFGLARMLEKTQRLTGAGGVVGTPEYMSPEQAAGRPTDHRTDVYSMGVVLYEMVSGVRPFTAETPLGVLMKHIQEPIPALAAVRPDATPALESVMQRALAKTPEERFQSAGELAAAFRAALGGQMAAPPPTPGVPAPAAPTNPSGAPQIDISKYAGLRANAEKAARPHQTPSMARLNAVRPATPPPPAAPQQPVVPQLRRCPECNTEIPAGESLCPNCFFMLPFEEVATKPIKPQYVREEVHLNLLPYSLRWDHAGLDKARSLAAAKVQELAAHGWELAVPLDQVGTFTQGRSAGGAVVQMAVLVMMRPG
jgi:serine/threonine protein kinase